VTWYENIHVGEVIATGGVPGAARCNKIYPPKGTTTAAGTALDAYPYLTLYAFPSLPFRETAAFKGLDGQSRPKRDLLQTVFSKAEFATRFIAVEYDSSSSQGDTLLSNPCAANPPAYLAVVSFANVTLSPGAMGSAVGKELSAVKGVDRVQIFGVRESTILREFNRTQGLYGKIVQVGLTDEEQWDQVLEGIKKGAGNDDVQEWAVYEVGRRYEGWQ